MRQELLDLDTFVQVKKAAPYVTVVPFDMACWIVRGMDCFSRENRASVDQFGQLYWQTTVKTLAEHCKFDAEITLGLVGRTLKAMGLVSWRKMDGFHIAWSLSQMDILKKYFKA